MKVHTIATDPSMHLVASIYYDPSYLWVAQLHDTETGYEVATDYLGGCGKYNAAMLALRLLEQQKAELLSTI